MTNISDYDFFTQLKLLPFITDIYVYGSRARGEEDDRSDIDLAVSCPDATDGDWQQVLDIIDHADTLLSIDVVRLDTLLEGTFKDNISKDQRILYRRER